MIREYKDSAMIACRCGYSHTFLPNRLIPFSKLYKKLLDEGKIKEYGPAHKRYYHIEQNKNYWKKESEHLISHGIKMEVY